MTLIEATQEGVDAIIAAGLNPDGDEGNLTLTALKKFETLLKAYFASKNYVWQDQMVIGIRMDNKYTNQFTDWGVIYDHGNIYIIPISTKPGASYQKNAAYVAEHGGCACIVPGQYLNMWSYRPKGGWSGGDPYLMQISPCTIYRDSSMGDTIDTSKTETGMFGINFHTWKGFAIQFVQNLSAGCQVMDEEYLLDIDFILQKFLSVSYTCIEFSDFSQFTQPNV